MNTSNINKILLATTVLLVLVIGGFLGWQMLARDDNYYAVMTLGGDLFFGKLHSFRGEYLTNVWTLQRNPQDPTSQASLVKFDQSVFGPEDKLELNEKNIIWKTKLKADSQVLAQIKNPTPVQQQVAPQPSQSPLKNIIK